jgi:BirA family biotin operon repressor/biotin-[acetyl-CoA-carboxylase] ligase
VTGSGPLDDHWIRAELARRRASLGLSLRYVGTVGSTSDLARQLATDGAAHGTTVVTDEQTAGRGRRGASRWQTPPCKSVAMSVVLRPASIDPAHLGRFGLCVGVAVAEAIERSTGVAVAVKWPNDLVIVHDHGSVSATRKLGGILVEPSIVASAPARVTFVVVGVGINANVTASEMAPVDEGALSPVGLLDVMGQAVSRERLIVETLLSVGGISDGWTDPVWPLWQARYASRMAWLGTHVVAESDLGTGVRLVGRVEGVDVSGALVLAGSDGVEVRIVDGRVRPT